MKKILFLAFVFYFAFESNAQTIDKNDSLSLVLFYKSTNGNNWKQNTNWLTSNPAGTWFGVKITNKRVTELHLGSNNLSGIIPPAIANLKRLQVLDLSGDTSLSFDFPISFGNLINLHTLNLSGNHIRGTIPSLVCDLTKLTNLDLSQNYFNDPVPPAMGNLVNLVNLNLSSNKFSTIPGTFINLKHLAFLDLSINRLNSIPPVIGNFTGLTDLRLHHNPIAGNIPAFLGGLINLTSLEIWNTAITGKIPAELGNLVNLVNLNLSFNHLSGSIPSSFSRLINLSSVNLEDNDLTGDITFLAGFKKLADLYLGYNRLSGSIPSFSPADNAGQPLGRGNISLTHNQLSGHIPPSLANSAIFLIDLSYNKLTGNIPFTGNASLGYFNLSHNQLDGAIPSSLFKRSNLQEVYLDDNQLSGGIENFLADNKDPIILDVSNNQLSGGVLLPANGVLRLWKLYCGGNHLNFTGMEAITNKVAHVRFNRQTLRIIKNGCQLSIAAGGVASHNRYDWYRDSTLFASNTGDSILYVYKGGNYSVFVTDTAMVANNKKLEIRSDTVFAESSAITVTSVPENTNRIYTNMPVTFKAHTVNAGTVLQFRWTVNGAIVENAVDSIYTSTTLKNNDTVRCVLVTTTDSIPVIIAVSNYIRLAITTPVITVTAVPDSASCIYANVPVTFKAKTVNAGAALNYMWTVNGVIVENAVDSIYINADLKNDDTVKCALIGVSNSIPITVATSNYVHMAIITPVMHEDTIAGYKPVMYKNRSYSTSTTLRDTLHNVHGCDSVYTLINITVLITDRLSTVNIKLYPNPTASTAILQLQGVGGPVLITITDILGKKLWQQDKVTADKVTLPVENLAAGLYIVTVKDDTGQVTLKLEKVK